MRADDKVCFTVLSEPVRNPGEWWNCFISVICFGRTAYRVFELDGTEREDEPFDGNVDEMTEFNRNEKSITVFHDGYWESGDVLKYQRRSDGIFHVTDSTHILYKQSEDTVTDSIRIHYRKQGDEMVLVKKDVVD